jgi:TonB family protein
MKRIFLLLILWGSFTHPLLADDEQEAKALAAKAEQLSNLTASGSQPFHLKLEIADIKNAHPEFNTEFEMWWAAPDKWRREIKSSSFSQTAIQNGARYSETNSTEYLPWWLHEMISQTLDPLPLKELETIEPDMQGPATHRCINWEAEFSEKSDKVSIYCGVCFNADGTVGDLHTRTSGGQFSDYRPFGNKRIPGSVEYWTHSTDGKNVGLRSHIAVIEPLIENNALFNVTDDTGLAARMRFVSVTQSALESYKLDTPPMKWPVIHNFPGTGMMAINVQIDRSGAVREVGITVSKNIVLAETAEEQIKKWKFRPFLVDGAPVQVNTDIGIHFDTKVEILGSNGAPVEAIPFFQRIQKSRELSDLHTDGGKPFHLHANVQYADNSTGTYDEIWQAPTKWRREATSGAVSVIESQNGDRTYRKVVGSKFSPRQVDAFLDELEGHFPRTDGSFIEGDWGQSAVQFQGASVVRVARGRVDANNQPIDGQAYWFDSSGLLQAAYVAPRTSVYSSFADWNGKQVPRKIEVTENKQTLLTVSIDQIESPASLTDSTFVVSGAKAEKIVDPSEYKGPVIVHPEPIFKVKPVNPHVGKGTVVVEVNTDKHGHVRTAHIRRSAGQALDEAAIQAAMQWEFTPMMIKGRIVPGFTTITFDS